MKPHHLALPLALALTSSPAWAEQIFNENVIFYQGLCAGQECLTGGPGYNGIEIRAATPVLDFTSTIDPAGPRTWQLGRIADVLDALWVIDRASSTSPVVIVRGAPDNALFIDASGSIGLGTSMPQSPLHLKSSTPASVRLTQDTMGPPQDWLLTGGATSFGIQDATALTTPFLIMNGTENFTAVMQPGGKIGMGGLFTADKALHIRRSDGSAGLHVEDQSAGTAPRALLQLENNGRSEIVMGNTSTGGEWSFGAGTHFVLKQGAVGSASSAKTKMFEIQPSGNAILAGSLTTGGTTCGGGCDLVFTDAYDLPSITEHADAMFALGYLPNVGPTIENAPFNLTDKLGRMLNELEHAHIYIARLEADTRRIPELQATTHRLAAENAALAARLARLEAALKPAD